MKVQIPDKAVIGNNCGIGERTSFITGIESGFFTNLRNGDSVEVQHRGKFPVSVIDKNNGVIFSASPLPAGTTFGDYLVRE